MEVNSCYDENYNNIKNSLAGLANVKITNEINCYINKNKNKCINEFEIIGKISRGLIWKVKKVLRYFYNDEGNLVTETYALKKTHVNTQKTRRYYIDDKLRTYLNQICDEIQILSLVGNHENVAALYEVLFAASHPFIYQVCEYCDLGTIMNKHPENYNYYHNYKLVEKLLNLMQVDYSLSEEEINPNLKSNGEYKLVKHNSITFEIKSKLAKFIFPQILKGLNYIHQNKVAHLDIKPDNIVFSSKDNLCKIIDFSHSFFIQSKSDYINIPGGSIHFQAPELFTSYDNNNNDNVKIGYYNGFKSDIWSLGIFIFIFLAEKFPFDSDSELELQLLIANTEPEFPSYFDQDTIDFLNKLLTKNPNNRLTDIQTLLNDKFFN